MATALSYIQVSCFAGIFLNLSVSPALSIAFTGLFKYTSRFWKWAQLEYEPADILARKSPSAGTFQMFVLVALEIIAAILWVIVIRLNSFLVL